MDDEEDIDEDIDLDALLESLYDEEDIDFIISGVPIPIVEDKTEKLAVCKACNGVGKIDLLFTRPDCDDCDGNGLVVVKL